MPTLIITHADARFCDFLRRRFEMRGHVVVRTRDSGSCLSRCREERPDTVAISLASAGRNDFALLKELQASFPTIRRIVIAESADPEDISECRRYGCQFYIRRYFRVMFLIEDLERSISGQTLFDFSPANHTVRTPQPTI
jgi:DNA-binding NarL/FixJ family response regulator